MINSKDIIYNSFNINATCDQLIVINLKEDLIKLSAKEHNVLGGCSNILFTEHYAGVLLKNEIKGIKITSESEDHVVVQVGGGEVWHELVLWAVDHNYGGIENLSLIPGSVGAAPIQNIGAYGAELADVLLTVHGYNYADQTFVEYVHQDCNFGYRESIFKTELKNKLFIHHITIKLTKKNHKLNTSYGAIKDQLYLDDSNHSQIKKLSNAVIKIRQSKLPDPIILGNCGSFFKNPIITKRQADLIMDDYDDVKTYPIDKDYVKIPAAWLIEKSGYKGKRRNDVGTYKNHALVIINYGNSTGKEIWDFAQEIIDAVDQRFNVKLTPEVNVW